MPATTFTPGDTPDDRESDESLMLRYAGGELSAFDALYTRHEMTVWRFVFRSVRNQAVADDLMQDVWFAVARQGIASSPGRPKTEAAPSGGSAAHAAANVGAVALYEVKAKFKTWLFTIAHHRMVDHFRTSKNHTSLDGDGDEDKALHETLAADSGFGPMQQLQSREQAAALISAVEELPAQQREAFLLQVEAGLSVAEIAVATGVNFETAKSRLRYARSSLKQSLREFA